MLPKSPNRLKIGIFPHSRISPITYLTPSALQAPRPSTLITLHDRQPKQVRAIGLYDIWIIQHVNMWLSHWRCGAENVHFSFYWRPSVTLKYAKNAFAAGAPPRTPTPLGACGAFTLVPSALASRRPPTVFYKSNTARARIAVSITHSLFLFFRYSLMK